VALKRTDLTDFVIRHALRAAKEAIEEADRVRLCKSPEWSCCPHRRSPGLVIDAKSDRVTGWYASYGAAPLPDAPLTRISHTPPSDVARTLVSAVSRLVSTRVRFSDKVSSPSVGMSADAAGRSACATSQPSACEKVGLTLLLPLATIEAALLTVAAPWETGDR
jgi:hypothetical protein